MKELSHHGNPENHDGIILLRQGSESLKDMFFQHVHFLFLFISIEIEKEGDEYGGAFKNGRDHQAVWCSLCQ